MKVIVSFIEDDGNPDYPITRHVFPIADVVLTVHVTPVNNGLGYDTVHVRVPRPVSKRKVKKEGWVHPSHICDHRPAGAFIPVIYEI